MRGLGNRCLACSRDSYNTSEGVTAMTHARASKARPPGRIVDGVAVVDTVFEQPRYFRKDRLVALGSVC